jgi:hypothetical protein
LPPAVSSFRDTLPKSPLGMTASVVNSGALARAREADMVSAVKWIFAPKK